MAFLSQRHERQLPDRRGGQKGFLHPQRLAQIHKPLDRATDRIQR